MTEEKSIESRVAVSTYVDGITRNIFKEKVSVVVEDAMELIDAIDKLTNGAQTPFLVDVRLVKSITGEARHYFAGPKASKLTRGVAFLVESQASRVLGNFFIGLNKPKYPARIFNSEEKAIEWLKGLLP